MKAIWSIVRSDVAVLGFSGIAGAIVASVSDWKGWKLLVQMMVVGGLSAMYLSDLIIPIISWVFEGINIPSDRAPRLGAFIVGLCGIAFVSFVQHIFMSFVAKKKRELEKW